MPEHIAADEKHTSIRGEKAYVATVVGHNCILGAQVCSAADETELTKGYKVFADESKNIDPTYSPQTVNIDGWTSTKLAFMNLFSTITVIRCFLHAFIKVRDCCKTNPYFNEVSSKIWDVYFSKNKRAFSQRLRRLKAWALIHMQNTTALDKIIKMHSRSLEYQLAYSHQGCHRTSNMCDRLMKTLDKALFDRQTFHGYIKSADDMAHSWAILHNFYPYCMKKLKSTEGYYCPSGSLNCSQYSDKWLHNLLVSSSMNGYRQ
jgi:hypothetical protein